MIAQRLGVMRSRADPGAMDVRTVLGDRTVRLRGRKPAWLNVPAPGGLSCSRLSRLVRDESLHTVCQQAACPIAARPAS